MRTTPFLFSILGATLISAGAITAHAAEGVYYDPSNAASPTGKTVGHELFRTIGCPGKQLLDAPCKVPAPAPEPEKVVAAEPVAAPAPAPAYVAPAPAPEPAAPQKLVLEGVNFDFDKATLRQEDIGSLDNDVATLKT
ncbi:MAG: OmpA family protein, partial [Thiobacillus sp.]